MEIVNKDYFFQETGVVMTNKNIFNLIFLFMKTILLDDFLLDQDFYISEAEAGKIFVYPTDTIYGIG